MNVYSNTCHCSQWKETHQSNPLRNKEQQKKRNYNTLSQISQATPCLTEGTECSLWQKDCRPEWGKKRCSLKVLGCFFFFSVPKSIIKSLLVSKGLYYKGLYYKTGFAYNKLKAGDSCKGFKARPAYSLHKEVVNNPPSLLQEAFGPSTALSRGYPDTPCQKQLLGQFTSPLQDFHNHVCTPRALQHPKAQHLLTESLACLPD